MLRTKGLAFSLAITLAAVAFSQACGKNAFEAKQVNVFPSNCGASCPEPLSSPTPGPGGRAIVAEMKTWNDVFPHPTRADDCLTNSAYNLCLVYKDPVSANGGAFSPPFTPTSGTLAQEAKVFVYGVKVPLTVPQNDNMILLVRAPALVVTPTAKGDWKHSYIGDTNHYVSQMQSWYWMNRERSYFLERTGTFHASTATAGKKLAIRPYENVKDNAYFYSVDYSMYLGYSTVNQGATGKAELALDTAVIAHEMGHANYYIANKSSIDGDFTSINCLSGGVCCKDKNGCPGAIHEGIGDLHAKFMFPDEDATILNYFFNRASGYQNRDLDYIAANNVQAQALYNLTGAGEIHDLGTVYASIWYGVWTKAATDADRKDIEKLFMEHMVGVGGSDTFLTAYTTISALAVNLFPAKAVKIKADFKAEYARMGLTVN